MPFLRDEGPPVSRETIEEARRSLPVEYGYKIVNERGRSVILVRVPKAKPDYLHELADVALYVGLEQVRDVKDVLLVGDEKVCRLEPVLLRDHIRERRGEDQNVATELMRRLDRNYGVTVVDHKHNMAHHSIAVRVPRASVSELTAEDVEQMRTALRPVLDTRLGETQAAYILADAGFERVGRRVFLELVDPDAAKRVARTAAPAKVGVVLGAQPPPAKPLSPPRRAEVTASSPLGGVPGGAMPADPVARAFVQSALSAAAPPAEIRVPAAPPPPPAPPSAPPPSPGFVQTVHHEEFEVFVSKRVAPDATPVDRPRDEVTDIVSKAARPPSVGPAQDSGAAIVVATVPVVAAAPSADGGPLEALASRLSESGYRVVRGLSVENTAFDVAAHREGGRRILAKTLPRVGVAEVQALHDLAERLGADACLVVAGDVAAGARLAAWGTRVEILSAVDAASGAL